MFTSFLLFVKLHSEISIRVLDARKLSAESDEPTLSLDSQNLQPMIHLWNYTSNRKWCVQHEKNIYVEKYYQC